MHAYLRSARLAPKKANLVAEMVRGMPVPDAVELLRRTSKKGARLLEGVLRSAMANAEHNFKQNANGMIVKEVIVNQGTALRRGIPMARGRVRPIKKFLCHIEVKLGFVETTKERKEKKEKKEVSAKSTTKKSSNSSLSSSSSSSS